LFHFAKQISRPSDKFPWKCENGKTQQQTFSTFSNETHGKYRHTFFDIRHIKRRSKHVCYFCLAELCVPKYMKRLALREISIFIGPLFAARAEKETVSPRTEIEEIAI
jgi:hypothetical protein